MYALDLFLDDVRYGILINTLSATQLGTTPTNVPLTKSEMFPDASRIAEPPANITKTAYENAEISRASNVPFGIDRAGSFKSPEILAPACRPVTKNDHPFKIILFFSYT